MKKVIMIILIVLMLCVPIFAKSYVWIMNNKVIAVGPSLELNGLSVGDHELMLYIIEDDPNYITVHLGTVTVGNDRTGHSMKWNKRIKYRKP